MSDNIDWKIDNRGKTGATSAGNPETASRRRGSKLDLLKTAWNAVRTGAEGSVSAWRGHPLAAFLRKHLALAVLAVLVLFPVCAILAAYITRPAPGSAGQAGLSAISTDNGSGERKTKPAPGKPMPPPEEIPPPVVTHPALSSAVEPQSPAGISSLPPRPLAPLPGASGPAPNAPPPAVPTTGARPSYPPLVYTARHDKVFGEGCSGQLTLDNNGLVFQCADDPRANVRLALNDIESVDGNGVRLTSGKKYHFSIAGMGKSNAEQLFANWFRRVR